MRVVIVTTSFPRTEEDPSGHFVRSSARALAELGDEVHVIAPGGSLLDAPKEHEGITIHRAGAGALFGWPGAIARAKEAPWRLALAAPFVAGAAARLARIGSWDRAVAHWIVPCAFPLFARTTRPLEVRAHGADVRVIAALPAPMRAAVIRPLVARGASFVFAARSLLRALASSMPAELELALRRASHVEPPPIDVPDVREEARAKRVEALGDGGSSSRALLAVTACRLVASKRVELAIEAAAEADTKLVVIGDGPERAALTKLAALFGDRVTILGAVPRREALAWIAAADVLVHPSGVEGAPTVVREARALGVPVVACDAGDVLEWSKSDAGIVVAAPTARAIADAVRGAAARRA